MTSFSSIGISTFISCLLLCPRNVKTTNLQGAKRQLIPARRKITEDFEPYSLRKKKFARGKKYACQALFPPSYPLWYFICEKEKSNFLFTVDGWLFPPYLLVRLADAFDCKSRNQPSSDGASILGALDWIRNSTHELAATNPQGKEKNRFFPLPCNVCMRMAGQRRVFIILFEISDYWIHSNFLAHVWYLLLLLFPISSAFAPYFRDPISNLSLHTKQPSAEHRPFGQSPCKSVTPINVKASERKVARP